MSRLGTLALIQKQDREARVDARAFARVAATADGRRMLEVIERELGWNEPSSVGSSQTGCVDVNATLIRDGQKVAIKFIKDMISAGSGIVEQDEKDNSTEYTPKNQ